MTTMCGVARVQGYRSRASYKLLEMQDKDRLIRPGMTVVDLGAAPGGWSQVAAELVGDEGRVVASDILPMDSIAGVDFVQGDFTDDLVYERLLSVIGEPGADLVISDMAPNITGMSEIDQPRSLGLAELALELAKTILKPGAYFLVKLFQGAGYPEYHREMQSALTASKPESPRLPEPVLARSICSVQVFSPEPPAHCGEKRAKFSAVIRMICVVCPSGSVVSVPLALIN